MSTSISQSINYIENHLTESATVKEAAAVAGYSRHHFSRTFLAMTGLTPASYLRKRRLSEAARELVIDQRRILDIALDYQFGSHEAFTRSFQREFGVNPGFYRRQGRLHRLCGKVSLGLTNLLYPGQGIGHAPQLIIPNPTIVEAVIKPRPHLGRIAGILGATGMKYDITSKSQPVTIRQAHRQDIPALCQLYHELHEYTTRGIFHSEGRHRLQSLGEFDCFDATALTLRVRQLVDTVDVAIWVAELQEKVIGLAEVYLREDEPNELRVGHRHGYLQSLIVTESMRGRGVGKQLIEAAEMWSRESGATELRLDTWEFERGPLDFYERQGYRTLRRTLVQEL